MKTPEELIEATLPESSLGGRTQLSIDPGQLLTFPRPSTETEHREPEPTSRLATIHVDWLEFARCLGAFTLREPHCGPAPRAMPGSPMMKLRPSVDNASKNFLFLLLSLLTVILVYPVVTYGDWGRIVVGISITAVLITSLRAVSDSKHYMKVAIVLAIPTFVSNWMMVTYESQWVAVITFALGANFYAFIAWRVFVEVYHGEGFRKDRVYGAAAVYILIGAMFASAYGLIETLQPSAFTGLDPDLSTRSNLVYFSFVTLTTLGYGDIRPVSGFARSFANVEAVIGILYVAVVIARFSGGWRYMRDGERSPGQPEPWLSRKTDPRESAEVSE